MADAKDHEPEQPSGGETPDVKPNTPASKTLNSQDKQKDKPDSGQNEDG